MAAFSFTREKIKGALRMATRATVSGKEAQLAWIARIIFGTHQV